MAGIVVVFDFDKTILDVDSDNWVVDQLGATHIFNQLLPTMPWNSLMDRMMIELDSQGKTIAAIANVLKQVPIHPRIITAIKSAHAAGCDLRIVSDANIFFIETILEHVGLRYCFSEINTNPSFIDQEGRLRISPYHDFHTNPHACNLCPPNMCKGLIIERIQASLLCMEVKKKKLIYIGDGAGDYCPILKLKEEDYAMPRKNFPVWELICKNPRLVKPTIHEWTDGEEFANVLLQLIDNNHIFMQENNHHDQDRTALVDCKFQTTPVPAVHA